MINEGHSIVRDCIRRGRPGPYQLQASIQAVHCNAETFEATDWDQIVTLYDHLYSVMPSPVVALNRAIAITETEGAALIRWHYQKAGHIEIVHDVLKNELGGGVLPCGAFGANAAWFRLCCLAHNVLSAMKTVGLPPKLADARPKRLRFAVFTIPAKLIINPAHCNPVVDA